jgi:hypothetical protein
MPIPVKNLNMAPYYDTTEQELAKGYSKYLAVEGQVLQNRELNVAQGLILGNVKRITDLMIDDGSVVSGCNFVNNKEKKICILEPGEVYFNGLLIKVPYTEWSYASVPLGMVYVCLEVLPYVYTESDDPSLYDPAENIENSGVRGGHRLKYEATPLIKTVAEFEADAESNRNIIAIIKLRDRDTFGPIKPTPIFGKIYKQMAERTYDASGDFIARGLKVSAQVSDYPEYKYKLEVSEGRAYVKGFNYTYNKPQYFLEDLALVVRSNEDLPETKSFITGVRSYTLNRKYIKAVTDVNSFIKISNIDMTGFSHNVLTALAAEPYKMAISRVAIASVVVNGYSTADYTFNPATNIIVWNISSPPSSYTVNADVNADLVENEDYYITKSEDTSIINFKTTNMVRDDTQTFSVTYSWFLSRYDLVYIKEDGCIAVKTGIPNELELIKQPNVPVGTLPLAYVRVEPGISPEKFVVESFNIYSVPTIQLQTMKRKISDFEYNFAMTELEQIAQSKHTESDDLYKLKNIFADGVTGYSKLDLDNRQFDATVDVFRSEVRLPMIIDQVNASDVSFRNADGTVTAEEILHLDISSHKVADFQPYITHNIDIAPFYYKGLVPKIVCDPKKLKHIEDSVTDKVIWLPNRVIYSSRTVNRWSTRTGSQAGTRTVTTSVRESTIVGEEIVETKKQEIDLVPQPYIKAGSILKVIGDDFPPDTEIRLYLDEKVITPEFSDPEHSDATDVSLDTLEYTTETSFWKTSTWKWGKQWWNGKWYWRFWPPSYGDKGVSLYYDESDGNWYWEKSGFGTLIDGSGKLTDVPDWVKWLRRSPWWTYYYNQLAEGAYKEIFNYINTREALTQFEYATGFEESNVTVVTDWNGHFAVEIKIPENTPVGKHTVVAESVFPEKLNPSRYFYAFDEFTGESYIRHWVNEIYMRKVERVEETIYVERITTVSRNGGSDPVAQSFSFSDDLFLTGIDVYFSHVSVDPTARVWFNIRETLNGYPSNQVIYRKDISISDINTPTTTNPFPATHIAFDYPVYCAAGKEYAFTIGCNVDGFRIFYAKMGNRDLVTNEPVVYQPHSSGVMFVSSNNRTWTPVQDSDIAYTLYRADFDTSGKTYYVYFVNESCDNTANNFKILNVSIGDVVLENTDVLYEYTISATEPTAFDPESEKWQELNIEEMYEVPTSDTMKLYLKVTLSSSDSKVTPVVNTSTLDAFFAKYKTVGSYILVPLNIE